MHSRQDSSPVPRVTPQQLAPLLKREIESIRINPTHPGLSIKQIRQAGIRALREAAK